MFVCIPASDSSTIQRLAKTSKISYGLSYKYLNDFIDRGWVEIEKRDSGVKKRITHYFLTTRGRVMHGFVIATIENAKPISTTSRI